MNIIKTSKVGPKGLTKAPRPRIQVVGTPSWKLMLITRVVDLRLRHKGEVCQGIVRQITDVEKDTGERRFGIVMV